MNSIELNIDSTKEIITNVDTKKFLARTSSLNTFFNKNKYQKIGLFSSDTEEFLVCFIACLISKIEIVLLPNNKKSTILSFTDQCDYIYLDYSIETIQDSIELNLQLHTPIVYYTSGSTGEMKRVCKKFNNLYREILVLDELMKFKNQDLHFIYTVSHQHIYGLLFKALLPLITNKVLHNKLIHFPEDLNQLDKNKEYCLISSPSFIKRIHYFDELKDLIVLKIISSGGKLDYIDAKNIKDLLGPWPLEIYGSSETGGIAYRTQESQNEDWTCLKEVSFENIKTLVVKSPFFEEESIDTRDLVQTLNAEQFKLIGRSDRIVKIEEKRVSLMALDKSIVELNEILECYCVAVEKSNRQQVGCIIKISKTGQMLSKIELVKKIKEHLLKSHESVSIPKMYRIVDELPVDQQSKIQKKEAIGLFE